MNCPNPQCNTKNLPAEAKFCPNCGINLLQAEESKDDKYLVILDWLKQEFYNVASEKFNSLDDILEILQNEARYAVDKYLISRQATIQLTYVKNVNSMGKPIHSGTLDLILDRRQWYILFYPEKTKPHCWERYKSCSGGRVMRHNNKYALIDDCDVVILPCEYDDIQELPSGFIKFRKDSKYGLLKIEPSYSSENNEPKILMLTDCQYDVVFDFNNGYAKVKNGHEWYMIDKQGTIKMKQHQSNIPYKPSMWLPIEICDHISESTIHCLHELSINKIILGSTFVKEVDNLEERSILGIKYTDGSESATTHDMFRAKDCATVAYGTVKNENIISYCILSNPSYEFAAIRPKLEHLINRQILKCTDMVNETQVYESEDAILRIIFSNAAVVMEINYTNESIVNTFLGKTRV